MRAFLRSVVALLSRAFTWMTLSAIILLGAMKYGPTLVAGVLPDAVRPEPEEIAAMTPQKIMEALREIRGALE